MSDLWGRHHLGVPVGVVDVGSNTVRLLVSHEGRSVLTRRAMLRLGAEVERHGAIGEEKLAEVSGTVGTFVAAARSIGVERIEVLVTSPGRQASNADELVERLAVAARAPVRVLSAADEGRLAFFGALSATRGGRKTVAVCDVGGGSAQVVVGTRRDGPAWVRSIDLGSMRLTSRLLPGDPPGAEAVAEARAEVERHLDGFAPPLPQAALAVGGSARAVGGVVGAKLGASELEEAVELLADTPSDEVVGRYGVDPDRVRTLAAGAVILAAMQARLRVPLRTVRGGVREGAILELAERRAAA
jgi:exopolyphosphatase/guanosine-5'-triphosphate,3'-diphosphate pyrophosphatase